ncbi:MAG TPA: hypothetical protein VMR41_04345 [Patescibacteria group bacterium]|nr:hypothetical protein [Patescibacteria group bacterium]
MTDLSTENLIKMLPLGDEVKTQLLEKFDTFSEEQKVDIDEALWDGYYELYQLRLQENIQFALNSENNVESKLNSDFYSEMVKKTEEQMQQEERKDVERFDLSTTRGKLEEAMNKKIN